MSDLIVHTAIGPIQISNCRKTYDSVGMYAHDYCKFFGNVFKDIAFNLNRKYAHGIKIIDFQPQIQTYATKLGIKDTLLTPYIADQWLFAGFSV